MPQRTNDFQQLIAMLTHLLGDNAVVEESKMLADLVSGQLTEVDVYAEGTLAGHAVTIGIECRDHKRKQGPGWVNEMRSKHERLPTNLLILVSSSGFTGPAIAKADSFNIKTITPTQGDSDLVDEVLASLGVLTLTFTAMSWSNMHTQATVDLPTEWLENPTAHGVHMDDGQFQYYKSDGSPLVASAAFSSDLLNRLLDQQLAAQPELVVAGNEFNLTVPQFPEPMWAGEPLHMYWTADGEEPILVRVVMLALSGTGRIPVPTQSLNFSVSDAIVYNGKSFLTATTETEDGGNQGRLVMGEEVAGQRRFSVEATVYMPPEQPATTDAGGSPQQAPSGSGE